MTTYIYDNIEVVLTGRSASKKQKERRTSTNSTPKQLLEITPVDQTIDDWKKWVSLEDMYIIDEDDT